MNHTANTIDEKHKELLNSFHRNKTTVIPEMKLKIIEKKKKLSVTRKIEDFMDLKDEILELQQNIKKLSSLKKKYLMDNSKHIFNYFEEKKDMAQALVWINTAMEKGGEKFWMMRYKALILAEMGRYKEAIEAANKSSELAKADDNQDYPRMNEKNIAEWKAKLK